MKKLRKFPYWVNELSQKKRLKSWDGENCSCRICNKIKFPNEIKPTVNKLYDYDYLTFLPVDERAPLMLGQIYIHLSIGLSL